MWNFRSSFRQSQGPDWISLPQWFKLHGYTTLGTGKVYHPGSLPNFDEPLSWSQNEPYIDGYPRWVPPNVSTSAHTSMEETQGNTGTCEQWPRSLVCPIVDEDER